MLLRRIHPVLPSVLILLFLAGGLRPDLGPSASTWARLHMDLSGSMAFSCYQPVRIMPLGDSITRGSSSGTRKDPKYYISYRRDLYKSLSSQGYRIDFVGSVRSDGAAYTDFDLDHEGWPGERDEYIAQNIYNWLSDHPADIVLLHIGTNDMSLASPDTSPASVRQILTEIDRFNPQIVVVVARIIQRVPFDRDTATYNKNVNTMLDDRIRGGDRIVKVDLENGAGLVYAIYPKGDMDDEKHPYATGYAKMAVQWEQALKGLLPSCGCDPSSPSGPVLPAQPAASCRPRVFLPLVDH